MILYTLLSRSGSRIASVVAGLLLLAVGGYFLLRNAFGLVLPPIDWDLIWPAIVIASGIGLVRRALSQGSSVEHGTDEPRRPEAGE